MRPSFALPLVLTAFSPLAALRSQLPDTSVRVAVGFGVDTLGTSHEIFVLWRSYLSSGPTCSQQSPLPSLVSPANGATKRLDVSDSCFPRLTDSCVLALRLHSMLQVSFGKDS